MSNKTTVIYHSADFDGIFCREIARKFLGEINVKYIGWNFGDPALSIPDGKIFILDLPVDAPFGFRYKEDDVDKNGPIHPPGLVWIDHHKTSIDTHPVCIDGYRIDGVAACRLAWQYFNQYADCKSLPEKRAYIDREVNEPLAVRLAGEYDIWDKRDPRSELFQFGLRSQNLDSIWGLVLQSDQIATISEIESAIEAGRPMYLRPDGTVDKSVAYVETLLSQGRSIQFYQQQTDARIVDNLSFIAEFEGLKFLALNTARFNSLTFSSKDFQETGHDALMGFRYDGQKVTVSLYHAKHNTGIDLSEIAVRQGGGGHRGACGFTKPSLNEFLQQLTILK